MVPTKSGRMTRYDFFEWTKKLTEEPVRSLGRDNEPVLLDRRKKEFCRFRTTRILPFAAQPS